VWKNKQTCSMHGCFKRSFFYSVVIGLLVLYCALQTHAGMKGEVVSVGREYVRIDIGSEDGLHVGDAGRVYYTVLVGEEREPRSIYVASFTITRTFKHASAAKIDEAHGQVLVGYLVEITKRAVQKQNKRPPVKKVVRRKKTVKRTLKEGEIWRDPALRMSFVWVPGGCFEMGCGEWSGDCSRTEKPVHRVCINGFWMERHEVTQQQWKRLMGSNPSDFRHCGSQCPVEKVSWNEAVEFARKLSSKTGYTFRLPTEAEWEFACRSGGKKQRYAGGGSLGAAAWYRDNAGETPHHVGRKRPNGLGIYDMSGNVWEWCLDIYTKDAYRKAIGTLRNPVFIGEKYADIYKGDSILRILQGISGYRSIRGGSWGNAADRLRCSARIRGNPDSRRDWLGFRLVRELKRK
jgi:formylglycine-generating enzyme required for sulfatase activity